MPLVTKETPFIPHDRSSFSLAAATYFDSIAQLRSLGKHYNPFYGNHLGNFLTTVIPKKQRILMIGCQNFQLLDQLEPRSAVGIDCSRKMIELARERVKNSNITFESTLPENFKTTAPFDYIVMVDVVDHCQDVLSLLGALKNLSHENTRIIANMLNPAWNSLLRLASSLGIRFPDYERNLVASKILVDAFRIKGFQVTHVARRILFPRKVPLISHFLNQFLARLPFFEKACFIQYVTAKPRPTTPAPTKTCTVLIPCYNEEGNIAECVKRTPMMGSHTEILIINDGSKDRTLQIAQRLEKEFSNVRVLDQVINSGKGKAVLAGIREAKGDIMMILDADMTVPPEELLEFFEVIASGEAEFASGTRFVYQMENRAMRPANHLGNRLFSWLIEIITGSPCTDTLCGTKAMRKVDFQDFKLEDNSWGDFDLIFHAARKHLRTVQIPVHYKERLAGESKMRAFRAGIRFLQLCTKQWGLLP